MGTIRRIMLSIFRPGCIIFDWRPFHRYVGVDSCTCEEYDLHGGEVDESATLFVLLVIVGEPKGFPPIEMATIHIIPFFRIYLGRTEWDSASMCRNWRVNIDNLIVASFPTPTIYRRSWDDPRKKTLTRTETAVAVHQSLQLGDWKEISKVVKDCVVACFPTLPISTSRTASWRDSVLDFLGRCRSFAMAVHPNSIRQPRHRSICTSDRSFMPSIVAHLPFNRRRCYISVQL